MIFGYLGRLLFGSGSSGPVTLPDCGIQIRSFLNEDPIGQSSDLSATIGAESQLQEYVSLVSFTQDGGINVISEVSDAPIGIMSCITDSVGLTSFVTIESTFAMSLLNGEPAGLISTITDAVGLTSIIESDPVYLASTIDDSPIGLVSTVC